jgi:hypothetical protein
MPNTPYARLLGSAAAFIGFTILALWAWNLLSDPFGLPLLQYRHVLAGCILLMGLRWLLAPKGFWHRSASGGPAHGHAAD